MPIKKEKKELTPQQKKIQAILNWTLNIVCILIILFAFVLSIVTITQTTDENNLPHLGKKYFMAVRSDSMSGTFEKGDMIITEMVSSSNTKYEVGQVITFRQKQWAPGGYTIMINTHRIVEVIEAANGAYQYRTKGDHEALEDTLLVGQSDVIAIWGTPGAQGQTETYGKVLKGVGKINNWLNDGNQTGSGKSVRYFLVIVLPLILLFLGYAGVLVYSLIKNKVTKAKEVAVNDLSEEEKARLAQEYLASQGITIPEQQETTEEASTDAVEETAEEEVAQEEAPVEETVEESPVDEDKKDEE